MFLAGLDGLSYAKLAGYRSMPGLYDEVTNIIKQRVVRIEGTNLLYISDGGVYLRSVSYCIIRTYGCTRRGASGSGTEGSLKEKDVCIVSGMRTWHTSFLPQ